MSIISMTLYEADQFPKITCVFYQNTRR